MSVKTDNFIKTVALLARNEFLSRDKWILPSVCIAQAALESGWNLEAKTLFGIKGSGFTATTSEYYNGNYETIQASFRSYPNVASSVVGYYDFLANTPRYARAINNPLYKDAVNGLIYTTDGAAYATDPDYISKIVSIIDQYNLTQYDTRESASVNIDDLANRVIAGEFGNGDSRKNALGSNYDAVQARVNEILNAGNDEVEVTDTVIESMAREVIAGNYGNGQDRKNRLGDLYDRVQAKVNEILG